MTNVPTLTDAGKTAFLSAKPSRADRVPGLRSRGSHRGSFVGGADRTRIHYESGLEHDNAIVVLAQPHVRSLREQVSFEYSLDEPGRTATYTFDFLVEHTDGKRFLIAVKPAEIAARTGLRAWLEWLAGHLPAGCADGILLMTEEHTPPTLVADAELVHAVRREAPGANDEAVIAAMAGIEGSVRVADLVAVTGRAGHAFRAVVRQVAAGTLTLASPPPISHRSLVANARARRKP